MSADVTDPDNPGNDRSETDISSSDISGNDIAIVGMSGRFPGAADVAELWHNICAGLSGITRFTDDELRSAGVPEHLIADPSYVKAGAVIEGIELFDAGFFGINPREAQVLDPQQRLYLEHNWQALEDAGCDPTRFDGAIGVFGGSAWSSYLQNNLLTSKIAAAMGDLVVGLANDKDSLTTRVAHTVGLNGPAYSIQSYCSTSLVAVCAAATSLANFECDLALAGGVAITVPQRVGYLYSQGGIAPPDGECRAFDASGLGAPVGSGVGVVALRRLQDAMDSGDRVYAVIRGWAVNNDGGRKVGFTAPGVQGQTAVIAEALSSADLGAADIDYVEAHGTGTALGDASELAALQQVFAGEECAIGSIKTNVGHLDRAAGVTGLIKTALALHRSEIPPTRNLVEPNAQLRSGTAALDVVTSLREWPRREDHIRRAGVSAFGIGGTNAHVVLEEAPLAARPAVSPRPELLVWSARTAAAADARTEALADYLAGQLDESTGERLCDVAYTLQVGRQQFEHRRFFVAAATDVAVAAATDVAVAAATDDAVTGLRAGRVLSAVEAGSDCRVGFLIAGSGEQYPGMAADLYRTEPAFGAALDKCRTALPREFDGADPLANLLRRRATTAEPAADATSTGALDAAVFAMDYALARLMMSWGIAPAVLAGHELGELVAACLSGVLTLDSALALVAHRGRLLDALPDGTTTAQAPTSVKAELTGWITEHIALSAPRIPYVSNVSGTLVTAEQVTDPPYWAELLFAPAPFEASVKTLLERGDLVLLEIGPGQSLGAIVRNSEHCPQERAERIVASLPAASDPRPASTVLTEAVGRLWLAGVSIDWAGYQQGRPVAKVGLPGYPFQRERYWIDASVTAVSPGAPAVTNLPVVAEPTSDSRVDHVQLMRPEWLATPVSGDPVAGGSCVLVGGTAEFTGLLAKALRGTGADVVLVPADGSSATTKPDGLPRTVLDLRLLDAEHVLDGGSGDESHAAQAISAIARLMDHWGSDATGSTQIIVATRSGQVVAESDVALPTQAAAAVLPVVANLEYVNLQCRVVDLERTADAAAAVRALVSEVGHPAPAVVAAYRDGRRYLREFVPAAGSSMPPLVVRPGGTYLVTGGLGGVGLLVAEHLARAGADRLVLTSRSGNPPPDDPRQRNLQRLRDLGAELVLPAVDVTDVEAMRALLTETLAAGSLDGVLHTAAQVGRDSFWPLRAVDPASVAVHFDAKVGGARVLESLLAELTAEQAPDFCLLFSSTSAILGGLAFGSYAAANAALTAIAQRNVHRSATRWIAASWDTWATTLDGIEAGIGASMLAHSMSTDEALAAFDRVLAAGAPNVIVVAAGLADRLPQLSAVEEPAASVQRFPRPELPQPYLPPLTATERALAEVWTDVLGVEPVGTRDNFFDLSGNSLLALQMLALVKKRFGIAVASVTLFEAPTVHALAAVLDQQGASPAAGARSGPAVLPAADRSGAGTMTNKAIPITTAQVNTAPVTAARATTARPAPSDPDFDRRIAVVGMAGRFPGAGDVGTFWQNLCDGMESISFFSEEELLASGVDAAHIADPNYVPARPVLDDVTGFDAGFFGLSPRMAALTDPQQRLFLEVCWEALEQSGYAAPEHRSRVGVYGGANLSTYLLQMPEEALLGGDVSTYEIIMGNDKDALTTTVSYLFDLHGPSMAVQTFCSTSLVATHLAMQSLRNGECELALAGGVSIRVPDKIGHLYGPGGMETPDGHVRTFDAKAGGSLFGDGAAVVALKRLPDAIRDGDHIWSVIRGSAINNDGALKVGYTAPSVVGQARVIADAMADAGVTGEDISYIEAHGTATELGDPIELAALARAFGETAENQYCPIGSVKTNIGHLDRAAGVTGLIKTSLALRDAVIPASLHYTTPNPEIDFENSPFYVNTVLSPWQTRDGRQPMAGINSLGMGGTNVHVVVEQAPVREVSGRAGDRSRRYQVLTVSARTATAADQSCSRLAAHLDSAPDTRLADVAYTLQVGRKTFEHRRTLIATGTAEAAAALAGQNPDLPVLSRVDAVRGRHVALLFTGVGEQYPGMVAELYRREPVFRAALEECLSLLQEALPDTDLVDLLAGARGSVSGLAALLGRGAATEDPRADELERTEVVQPALFAVEYALARTLMTWGVQPGLMLGYSLGEYVAACLAGVLSLPDALALVCYRARLIATVQPGAMLAVSLPAEDLQARFAMADKELDIAALNGPQVTVVAGPVPAVTAFTAELRRAEVPCRALGTTHAFHSRMLSPIAEQLTRWVRDNITLNAPQLPYLSNVTGDYADADLVCDPGYWARHMCQPVQFAAAMQTLLADPELAVVEIGPGQSLGALVRSGGASPEQWPLILSMLPAGSESRPDDAALADCLARLWLLGVDLDWLTYSNRHPGARVLDRSTLPGRVPLPTYPFQRQRYWIEGSRRGAPDAQPPQTPQTSQALPQVTAADTGVTFETIAALEKMPEEQWLHLPVWRQTAAPAAAAQTSRSWLVYTRDGLADDVVAALRSALPDGTALSIVRSGDGFATEEDGYTVRPGSVEDTLALLRELRSAGRPLERVVHLWALQSVPEEVVVAEGLHTLVALARAAGELGMDSWSLDVVVSGTQQVLPEDVSRPHAAMLAGPCRVIPLEYPNVTSRLIDLDAAADRGAAAGVVAELRRPLADALVALRHGRRWLPEYEAMCSAEVAPEAVLRKGGVYLITGGLGGIALAMANRLARNCRAKLVLLARHGLPPRDTWPDLLAGKSIDPGAEQTRRRIAEVSALLELGAEVEVVTGDVSSADDVRRACELAQQRFGGLHGVLHVAGVPAMGLMQFKDPSELDQVLAPKVGGALAITEALRMGKPDEIELDFLVFFSSITSTTGGGPGQVDYCAGNAFLDSYAYQLADTGRKVLSINWGEWTWNAWEAGLTGYADALQDFFRQNRVRVGIGFEDGWRCLLRALDCGEPRVVVSTQDFSTMVRYSSQFTVAAVSSPVLAQDGGARHPRPELVTSYQEPAGSVEADIAAIWCESLQLERVGAQDNFFELGGNSLLGVSIVASLRAKFAPVELPPHILYEAPTVAALGKVIDSSLSDGPELLGGWDSGGSQVRAQLRRSGLEASTGRRRARQGQSDRTQTGTGTEKS